MPHIPRAFCYACGREMVIAETGAYVEAHATWGPYYKIAVDIYRCQNCKNSVMLPSSVVMAEHWEDNYDKFKTKYTVIFADDRRFLLRKSTTDKEID